MISRHKLARLLRWSQFKTRHWVRRIAFWGGALIVGLLSVGFAGLADSAGKMQHMIWSHHHWIMIVMTPGLLVLGLWMAQRFFPGSGGSGIPQVIAAIEMGDPARAKALLPLRTAAGKMVITCLGVLGGLSIGREGPTVQIAATLMAAIGRWVKLPEWVEQRGLIIAGGAAGISAAFNTPLAGVVFAIEELSRSFEVRTSGLVLISVILAGITSLGLVGDYSYFGTVQASLSFGVAWIAVPVAGVIGGVAGGSFSQLLIRLSEGVIGARLAARPLLVALVIGLVLVGLGYATSGDTFGTGYASARQLLETPHHLPWSAFPAKFAATVLSYLSGIPGGVFAPSLSTGAALGDLLTHILPNSPPGTVVVLGMAAYFTGVVQAPITAIVIMMEMTNNQTLAIPLMASVMIAHLASKWVCPHPFYAALAERFKENRDAIDEKTAAHS